jgi:4,5-dihydroxyphthalate decarboxylase
MFRHSSIYVNAASGIQTPSDLVGKRVGCPEYQMTAAVWIKGILSDYHDVPVNTVTYYTGGLEQPGREETPMDLPSDIKVVPIGNERTLSAMLDAGEIDALYTAHMPSCFASGSPNVRRLFANYAEVEHAYLAETGIFPIMHTIVVRTSTLEKNPWVARSLMKAFEESKERAVAELFETTALKCMLPWLTSAAEETRAAFGTEDFWPYGIAPNDAALTAFLRYSYEQGLAPALLEPIDIFAVSTQEAAKI